MIKIPDNIFLLVKSNMNNSNNLPPKEILMKPKNISFKEKFIFDNIPDKRDDDTNISRIICYHTIERAIEMENVKKTGNKLFDVYCPISITLESDGMDTYYPYHYLEKRGLVKPKKVCNRESWFIKPVKFKYMGTIACKNDNSYTFVMKDYNVSDIDNPNKEIYSEGFVENQIARKEIKKKGIEILFNCTSEKNRIIKPDQPNYGNKFSKAKYSSYWFENPENAILAFAAKLLVNADILEEDDFCILFHLGKMYVDERFMQEIKLKLNSEQIYLNMINVPNYTLFTGKHMGYGWDIFEYSYTYDKPIFNDNVRSINIHDILENMVFCDEKNLSSAKRTQKLSRYERISTHGYIFNKRKG